MEGKWKHLGKDTEVGKCSGHLEKNKVGIIGGEATEVS